MTPVVAESSNTILGTKQTSQTVYVTINFDCVCIAVELQLPRLTGTASHPDKHKFRIIGFYLKNKLHWQFEV